MNPNTSNVQAKFDVATAPLLTPTLLEASAGTGKTFSIKHLVLRFVVEAAIEIDHLLVVTFTHAATSELKVRINAHLSETLAYLERQLAPEEVEPLILRQVDLWHAAGISDEVIRGRIENALAHFDDAGIYTIHAFCQRTLDSTAFSSGAGIGMELQQDTSDIQKDVVRDFLRRELDQLSEEDRRTLMAGEDWEEKLKKLSSTPAELIPCTWEWEDEDPPVSDAVRAAIERFVQEAPAAFQAKKRELGIRTFDDMLLDLYRLVCPAEDASEEVQSRAARFRDVVRTHWKGVLVDEFQDTDPIQYAIFEALFLPPEAAEVPAEDPSEEPKQWGPVWFVGDPKQAIYSFRSADLNTYFRARERIRQIGTIAALTINYRSSEGLVSAFNTFWGHADTAFLRPGLDYAAVDAQQSNTGLWVLEDNVWHETKPLEIWAHIDQSHPAYGNKDALEKEMLQTVGLRIVEWIEAGRRGELGIESKTGPFLAGTAIDHHGREVHLRAVQANDIAILVRTNNQVQAVQKALAKRGVRVRIDSKKNVCTTEEAVELLAILRAFAAPGDARALRLARATRLVGDTLARLDADESYGEDARETTVRELFELGAKRWFRDGPAPAIERLMAACETRERLLPTVGGEQRLVNYAHLIELLHGAARTIASPAGLVTWLEEAAQKDDDSLKERLSSNANLVTVQTLHTSKGLQYPIVILAYAHAQRPNEQKSAVRSWPDDLGQLGAHFSHGSVNASGEQNAAADEEAIRLAYVGMTRAAKHLVMPFHPKQKSGKNSSDWYSSSLNNPYFSALLGKRGKTFSTSDVRDALFELARTPFIDVRDVRDMETGEGAELRRLVAEAAPQPLAAAPAQNRWSAWRTSSFTGISRMTEDETSTVGTLYGVTQHPDLSDDILSFPKGAQAGTCLHEILELADFFKMSKAAEFEETLVYCRREVARHLSFADGEAAELAARGAAHMLRDVLSAELIPGLHLRDVSRGARTAELEFLIPIDGNLTAERLAESLRSWGYDFGNLRPEQLKGFLTGFIDLAFFWQGRFYVLDWKSNRIADTPEGYAPGAMDREMGRHLYRLQYLIYLVALRRFLMARLGDAWRDDMLGGAIYVFLRGVREAGTTPETSQGIVYDPVDPEVIRKLDALFSGELK